MSDRYNTYVGARYVPIFDGDWDNTKQYEPLTVVSYQGNSYTSKTYVPTGALITNETYWAKTGNYNAQIEQLYEEVVADHARVDQCENDVADCLETVGTYDAQLSAMNEHLNSHDTAISNLNQRITNEVSTLNDTIDTDVATLNGRITSEVATLNGDISDLEAEIQTVKGLRGFVTPEMFDAVGDGTTDDTQAIKDMFNYACTNGVPVLGLKKYLISPNNDIGQTTTIGISCGITVNNLHLILAPNREAGTAMLDCYFKNGTVNKYQFNNCTFEMRTTGYPVTDTTEQGAIYAILFHKQNNYPGFIACDGDITIENCYFKNVWSAAVYSKENITSCRINNCVVESYASAFRVYTNRLYVTNTTYRKLSGNSSANGGSLVDDNFCQGASGSSTKRSVLIDNCASNASFFLCYRSASAYYSYDAVLINNCTKTTDGNVGTQNYDMVEVASSLSMGCVSVNNCNFGQSNIYFECGGGDIEIRGCVFNVFGGTTLQSASITNCTLRQIKCRPVNLLKVCDSVFDLPVATEPNITQTGLTGTEAICERLVLDSCSVRTGEYANNHLIDNFYFRNCYINNLSIVDDIGTFRLVNNGSHTWSTNTFLYAKGLVLTAGRGTTGYLVDGVTNVYVEYFGGSTDTANVHGATQSKVVQTYYNT